MQTTFVLGVVMPLF